MVDGTRPVAGEPIKVYAGFNDLDEARFIVERIEQWLEGGGNADEVAVLYRSNAQSRVIEEALLRANIAYQIYGGQRFFERAEIKNALAYMRLIEDRHSDPAFERVLNTPPRGIGDKSVESIRQLHTIHAGIGGVAGVDLALPAYHLLYENTVCSKMKHETE